MLPLLEMAMATEREPKRMRNIMASTAATPRRDLRTRSAERSGVRGVAGAFGARCASGTRVFTSSPPGWSTLGTHQGLGHQGETTHVRRVISVVWVLAGS